MFTHKVQRPKRWDQPFGDMSGAGVTEILGSRPFNDIDADRFPARLALRDILRNDARIVRYRKGDLVVRRGDYGNSAFFVLWGTVRIVLESAGASIPDEMLGRAQSRRRGFLGALSQLWRNARAPEVRDLGGPHVRAGTGTRRAENDQVRVFLRDTDALAGRCATHEIGPGESFGEIAALSRTPRTATVFAPRDCGLLEVRWQGLRDIRHHSSTMRDFIDRRYRQYSLLAHLREVALFAHLDDADLEAVAGRVEFETYGSIDWHTSYKSLAELSPAERLAEEPLIACEGDYPNGVILVRGGFARVTRRYGGGQMTTAYLGRGQDFGLQEIYYNWRHPEQIALQHSLRALGYVEVLIVPTPVLERHVLPALSGRLIPPAPEVARDREQGDARIEDYRRRLRGAQARGHSADLMEKSVEGRFINGTATMMINLDRCTRCDDCVRACAAAHDNNPRFIRHGPRLGRFMVANACMHCADPVCMIGCPTGAIHRNRDGGEVVINDATCIGCGTCASACPYENIRLVQVRGPQGRLLVDELTGQPIIKATKCDLCVDQIGGPACQRACPHDALRRVDMHDLDAVSQWMRR